MYVALHFHSLAATAGAGANPFFSLYGRSGGLMVCLMTEKSTEKGKVQNAEKHNRIYFLSNRSIENTVFKTRHLRNKKQMVIILKNLA